MNIVKGLNNAALDTLSYLMKDPIEKLDDFDHGKPCQILDALGKIFENTTKDQAHNLLSNDNFVTSLKRLNREIASIPQEVVETKETKEKLEGLVSRINCALNCVKKVDQIPGTILEIPEDLLMVIGQSLDAKDLLNLTQVNKKLLEASPKIIGQNENFVNFLLKKSLGRERLIIPKKLLKGIKQYGPAIKSISLEKLALRPKHLPILIDLFPNLESLVFEDRGNAKDLSEMTDPFIDLGKLKKLKTLCLIGSDYLLAKAVQHIPKNIENLEITVYALEDTEGRPAFKKELLLFIAQATSLKKASLRGDRIDDEVLQALAKSHSKLETFTLSASKCTKSGVQQFFARESSLKFIDLERQDIDDIGLRILIDSNPQLETLNLERCNQITKEGFLEALVRAKSLKSVDLSGTGIDDVGLCGLIDSNPELENLELFGNKQITKEGFRQALAKAKSLKQIVLSKTHVSDEALQGLIDSNPYLEKLKLWESKEITKQGFREALAKAKSLKHVNLSDTEIDDEGLQALIDSNPHLEKLDLYWGKQITKVGFRQALAKAKSLKYIALSGTEIDDEGLQILIQSNPRLEELQLARCRQITREGVLKSLARAGAIKFLCSDATHVLEGKKLQDFLVLAKSQIIER